MKQRQVLAIVAAMVVIVLWSQVGMPLWFKLRGVPYKREQPAPAPAAPAPIRPAQPSPGEKPPPGEKTPPPELADELETNARTLLDILKPLRSKVSDSSGAYECELDDLEAWAHLSLYFAEKLRAGVALETFRRVGRTNEKGRAIALLIRCERHWDNLIAVTEHHYVETPHVSGEMFSWANYRSEVERDIEIAKQAKDERKERR